MAKQIRAEDMGPEESLKYHALFVRKGNTWVCVDTTGRAYLSPSVDPSYPCHVLSTPYPWESRRAAKEAYNAWRGAPQKAGRKKTNPDRKPDNKARVQFERLMGCLMHLWRQYPSAITLDSVQRSVQRKLKCEFHQRAFRRDMESLVRWGYCVKTGPTYTAKPEFRRWWSDEFGDGLVPEVKDA